MFNSSGLEIELERKDGIGLDEAMQSVSVETLAAYCGDLLKADHLEDWPGARNGLQVGRRGPVKRVAAAVDGSLTTVRMAIEAGADLLVVHHGLFWGPTVPWTGRRLELIQALVEGNLAVYSSHLPLDAHPELGNNIGLCRALGFEGMKPFFHERGGPLGQCVEVDLTREELGRRLEAALGHAPTLLPGGPSRCRKVGVVTGGAGSEMALAAREGMDTFITGEGPHHTFALAEDLGLNVYYAGHYATETFGVRALAAHLAEKFDLEWIFLDHPSGL